MVSGAAAPVGGHSRPWTAWLTRDVIELLPAALCVCDADGVIIDCNARAVALWGRSPRLGERTERYCGACRLYDLDGAALAHDQSPMARTLRSGQPVSGAEVALERPDGSRCAVTVDVVPLIDEHGQVAGALSCLRETSDHATLGSGRRASHKLEAVRQLTGTVAHDFSNLMAAIALNLNLIEKHVDDPGLLRSVQAATRAVRRGSELTDQLMTFAGKRQVSLEATDLNALLAGIRGRLQRTVGSRVRLVLSSGPDPWPALVDPYQIETAILNLAANARDAMAEGGSLRIATANRRVAAVVPDLAPGDYVVVSVMDTGQGMSEAVMARAFEPFFTTRGDSKGTGLGLSIVLDIAKRHGGTAQIGSRVGAGTTVDLYLPRAVTARPNRAASAAPAPRAPGLGRGRTILLVDDDAELRAALADALEGMGCEVVHGGDGAAALRVLRSDLPVDLLLVDVKMAGMSGPEVVRRAHVLRPGLKVLVMTGYGDISELRASSLGVASVLRKPFRAEQLAAEIARLTDQPALRGRA